MVRQKDSDPDLVIDEGQVYGRVRDSDSPIDKSAASSQPSAQSKRSTGDLSAVDQTSRQDRSRPRGRIMRAIRKRLKPIYIGPLQPDRSGILNVRGHLGFMVVSFGLAAIGFAIFELIPVALGNGFYCPSIAIPFGILAIGLANSEFFAMKHKSIGAGLNQRLSKLGLILGSVGASGGLCVNVLGWIFYLQ